MTPDPLLEAIFRPGEHGLHAALTAVRRRRRIRRIVTPAFASAACLAVAIHFGFPVFPQRVPLVTQPVIETINSRPLIAREVVYTFPANVEIISTPKMETPLGEVGDAELLASFHPGGAALVGAGGKRRLIEF